MLMPMLPFLIRLGRASLVFAIAGGVAGLGIAADSPENPAVSLWTHPWGYRGAIAGIVVGVCVPMSIRSGMKAT